MVAATDTTNAPSKALPGPSMFRFGLTPAVTANRIPLTKSAGTPRRIQECEPTSQYTKGPATALTNPPSKETAR